MGNSSVLIQLIDIINGALDILVPITLGIWLIVSVIIYTYGRIQKEGIGKAIYLGTFVLFVQSVMITLLYILPQLIVYKANNTISAVTVRWMFIYSITVPYWYYSSSKNSGKRGVTAYLFVLTTFLLGWLYERWIGILFVSVPVLLIFFHATSKLAQTLIPANDPESNAERLQRTRVFLMYLLGIQFPIKVAGVTVEPNFETRIPGNSLDGFRKPGIIWTQSHQVVGLSKGIEFNRVDGPGIIFTEPYENPVALVDLRTQLRVSMVDTVTKDGMAIRAVVLAAFAIDKEKWPKESWQKENWQKAFLASLKYRFGENFEIDHVDGSFPYSSNRIRSTLRNHGVNSTTENKDNKTDFFWDQWVVKQVEHATRQVISERSLDELWRPRSDGLGISALDETATELRRLLSPKLTEAGINLHAARVVNYDLEEKDEDRHIVQQNIKTWSSHWEQRITEAKAGIEIAYREEIEKAHAYSKSILLSAIADSISRAREIHEDLPRHVIAQYYVHALEEYIKKQPGLDVAESKQRIENIKEFLLYNHTEGNE